MGMFGQCAHCSLDIIGQICYNPNSEERTGAFKRQAPGGAYMPKVKSDKPKGSGAPPVPYATPEALDAKCREYVDQCKALEVFPDEAGMLVFLEISPETKAQYESGAGGGAPGFAEVLQKYRLVRESALIRMMLLEPKLASPCAFLLKQSKNGGYNDKQQPEGKENLTVEFKLGIPDT